MCLRSDSAWGNISVEFSRMGCCTPPHSLQTQLVLGWCLKGLEVGEGWWGRFQRSSVWLEKSPSVVHWDTKSAHSPGSVRVWSFGYPFSQEKHINKSLLFGESVNLRCSNKGWSSMTQSFIHHLLAHAPHMNSHPTLHLGHHSYITLIYTLVSLAI